MKRIVELRERDGKRLEGIILQEGRAATERREVFAPKSVSWAASGIDIKDGHHGDSVAVAFPKRDTAGNIGVSIPLNPGLSAAFRRSGPGLSVEFVALEERSTAGGIREITKAYVDAAALVRNPEYTQAKAEIRKRRVKWL